MEDIMGTIGSLCMTQQDGKGLAGDVVIYELWRLTVAL
jgi:hypothetical protein